MSLIILKPEALSMIEGILLHFKNFVIRRQKMIGAVTSEQLRQHYSEHLEKPFFPNLEKQFIGHPVLVVEFENVTDQSIQEVRKIVGNYDNPNSIRGKYGLGGCRNMIHASDSMESFLRERRIWLS